MTWNLLVEFEKKVLLIIKNKKEEINNMKWFIEQSNSQLCLLPYFSSPHIIYNRLNTI